MLKINENIREKHLCRYREKACRREREVKKTVVFNNGGAKTVNKSAPIAVGLNNAVSRIFYGENADNAAQQHNSPQAEEAGGIAVV